MPRSLNILRSMVAAAVALAALLAYGWAEGMWTGRWQPTGAGRRAATKLKDVPRQIGVWEGSDGEFDERQVALAELDGYLYRIYANANDGQQVQVLVVCGRPGPISVHTPDVCYRGLGFTTVARPIRKSLMKSEDGADARCWTAEFQRPATGGKEYLRIAWTWFADGGWHAADQPRFEFARESTLFKVYLIHPVSKPDTPWDEDPIPHFAKQLLPVLADYLTDRAPNAGSASGSQESPASAEEDESGSRSATAQ